MRDAWREIRGGDKEHSTRVYGGAQGGRAPSSMYQLLVPGGGVGIFVTVGGVLGIEANPECLDLCRLHESWCKRLI
jgi:hypothetical protein